MSILDIIVCAILVISSLIAFHRGLISSTLSLAGWVSSFLLTYWTYPKIEPALLQYMSLLFASIVGYGGLFMAFLVLFALLNTILNSILSSIRKGFWDRTLGMTFGFIRGILIVFVLFIASSILYGILQGVDNHDKNSLPKTFRRGYSYNILTDNSGILVSYIPSFAINSLYYTKDELDSSRLQDKMIFLQSSTNKLTPYVSDEMLQQIKENISHDTSIENEYESQMMILKQLIREYQENLKRGNIPADKSISHMELIEMARACYK